MRFGKKSKSKSLDISETHYSALGDVSMAAYEKVLSGDLTALRRGKKGCDEGDQLAAAQLEENYFNRFGYGERFMHLHRLKNELAELQAEYIISGQRMRLNFIRVKESQVIDLEQSMNGLTIRQAKIAIEKWLGYAINFKAESVLDFYTKLDEYGRG